MSLKEFNMGAGHKVLMEVDDNYLIIVIVQQGILS
jgi:hypothetical protein